MNAATPAHAAEATERAFRRERSASMTDRLEVYVPVTPAIITTLSAPVSPITLGSALKNTNSLTTSPIARTRAPQAMTVTHRGGPLGRR